MWERGNDELHGAAMARMADGRRVLRDVVPRRQRHPLLELTGLLLSGEQDQEDGTEQLWHLLHVWCALCARRFVPKTFASYVYECTYRIVHNIIVVDKDQLLTRVYPHLPQHRARRPLRPPL